MKRALCLAALSLVVTMLIFVSVAGAQKQATKTVSIQDSRFSPAKITVKPGTKVTWVNRGDAPHTVTGNDNSVTGGNASGDDGGNASGNASGGNANGANGRDGGVANANNGAFDSGALRPGERFSVTFKKPGKFAYHCEIHPKMKGSVTVKRRR